MDRLSLTGLSVDCIVGVHPGERHMPQPLGVDLTLHLDTRAAAREQRLRETVDYARLFGEIRFLLQASRFLLIESAAEALAAYILAAPSADAPHAAVQEVTVRLHKPQALAGAGLPTLEIQRSAAEYDPVTEPRPFGQVDLLFSANSCAISRLRIAAKQKTPIYTQSSTRSELVLGPGLLLQGRPVAAGTGRQWPRGIPRRYENTLEHEVSILYVDRPAGGDEIVVDGPSHDVGEVEFTTYFQA